MLKMIAPDHALHIVLEHARVISTVKTSLKEALGCTLAEDLVADRDYPPFDRAMMDGYAARLNDKGKSVDVVGEVPAGTEWKNTLSDGECLEIMTGAPCPIGTEVVVKKEDVSINQQKVSLPTRLEPNENIVRSASDCQQDSILLCKGTYLTPLSISVCASIGRDRILVNKKPSIFLLTTGSELVDPSKNAKGAQIRNSNAPMLFAMSERLGLNDITSRHADDKLEALRDKLDEASDKDIVVLSGGVSMGKYDLVPQVLSDVGAETIFHKVKQKPGKPLLFAVKDRQLIFGLPGTPLGSHLGFHRYVSAAVLRMLGKDRFSTYPEYTGILSEAISTRGERTKFILVRVERKESEWYVTPEGGSSSNLFRPSLANAYVRVPGGEQKIAANTPVNFEWCQGIWDGAV